MVKRAFSGGRGCAREIESPEAAIGNRRADDLHHIRIGPFARLADFSGDRRDVDSGIVEQCDRCTNRFRIDGRKVALEIDDEIDLASGVDLAERLENAIRAG